MPTYAIIGATGSTGQQILSQLLQSPDNKVHAYCRSKSKLEKLSPKLAAHQSVDVYSGALNDVPLIASCIANTTAIFLVIGSNTSYPGMRMVEDGTHSVVAALSTMRAQDPNTRMPRILLLSSATMNPRLQPSLSTAFVIFRDILKKALFYAYEDLGHAEDFLRLQKEWLNVTFIHPGGLVEDKATGHTLTLDTPSEGFIGYPDLAAGMIEVAKSADDRYSWEGVGVLPKKSARFNPEVPFIFARGLLAYYLPPVYWAFHSIGLAK
ncbi:MAG: hypothetical protein Q9219_006505 [cf. Caloplaca sp. 3 TL-2023]